MLTYLREVDEHARSALVVGHNPTMYQLIWDLLADGVGRPGRGWRPHGFPTCALAVLALHVGGWEDIAAGCGPLVGLFGPPY